MLQPVPLEGVDPQHITRCIDGAFSNDLSAIMLAYMADDLTQMLALWSAAFERGPMLATGIQPTADNTGRGAPKVTSKLPPWASPIDTHAHEQQEGPSDSGLQCGALLRTSRRLRILLVWPPALTGWPWAGRRS